MSLRLGMCGLYFHINAVLGLPEESVRLVGIADKTHPQGSIFYNPNVVPEELAKERKVPLYDNYMALLDGQDPDIVAVYCVDSEKADVIVEALQRGKHVVSDKPLDAQATLPLYRLLCTTFPPADRGPTCNAIGVLRGAGSAAEKKRAARDALSSLMGRLTVPKQTGGAPAGQP